ncbi:MAG: anti-sigma factor antagonist [Actinomycetota bacterium]|nr:anti-sigma factor antagonist [Actinomycetota bacterium]
MPDSPLSAHRFGNFGATIDYDAERAVVGVRGEVDMLTAPTLGDLVDVLIDRGERQVVLDLAGLAFMDAAGLRVIADASARLALSGGVLTVRSPPPATLEILRITDLADLVRIQTPDAVGAPLGPEQRADDHSFDVDGGVAGLTGDLARVGAAPATDQVIDAALALVTSLATATVEGADGVSVILQRHGRLTTVASSNETVQRMDDHQYETGEGPCLAAAAQGHWFHIESLAEEDRWPMFIPLAIEEGISSVLSTPLMKAGRPLGALNIYSSTARAFGPRQQELAALLATQASSILVNAGTDRTDEELDRRISAALAAREVIAQAQGVLMAHQAITSEEAASVLRRSARSAEITVATLAARIVDSTRVKTGPDA